MTLPLDISRCWGNTGSRICERREQCARYIGRNDKGDDGRFPPSMDFMCGLSWSAFRDVRLTAKPAQDKPT